MKQLAIVTVLSLITATQAFAGHNGLGDRIRDRIVDRARDYVIDRVGDRFGQQNQRIQLHLGQHYRGQNVIKLKQELRYQQPGMDIRNLELVAVRVVAKSKKGRGQATLLVGQSASYPETIGGNPLEFHVNAGYTFDKMRINNPGYDSLGKWQIELRGNIKVKKVVLIVKKKMRRGNHIVIPMYDQHLRGMNTLKLKRLIKQQNPSVNLQMVNLKSVTLVAKSKQGRGQATLVVGQSASYPETVSGNPRMFRSMNRGSYTPITLQNPSYDSMGKWQIELRGNIKVKEIIIKMNNSRLPRGPRGPRNPRNPRRGGRI